MRGNNSSRQDRERKASAEIFLFMREVTINVWGRLPLPKDEPQKSHIPSNKKKDGFKNINAGARGAGKDTALQRITRKRQKKKKKKNDCWRIKRRHSIAEDVIHRGSLVARDLRVRERVAFGNFERGRRVERFDAR
jgi:hypothetical protein